VVTLAQIKAARPEWGLDVLHSWKASAAQLVAAAESYQKCVRRPGGEIWLGESSTAAFEMVQRDRRAIANLRCAIDDMADKAINAIIDPVISNLNRVRAKIASVESAGLTVNEDLTIPYPSTTPPHPIGKEEVDRWAIEVRDLAARWWESDQRVADQINWDKQDLAYELKPGYPRFELYERVLREAGLLTGPSPTGYYAKWLDNAERRRVPPEVLVEIARRHGITPENFQILESMEEITDEDEKSFFLLPEDISGGDDARKAVVMTYILNAGTDYDDAGKKPGVRNDFKETPYSVDEVQRIIDRQEANDWSYDDDVEFVHANGARLVTTPNGMLMGAGGNWIQDMYSWDAGTTYGDIFMIDIDDPENAGQQLRDIAESGNVWQDDHNGEPFERTELDLDRFLHHEERHSQQWADKGYLDMLWDYAWDHDALEDQAGRSDAGYL